MNQRYNEDNLRHCSHAKYHLRSKRDPVEAEKGVYIKARSSNLGLET